MKIKKIVHTVYIAIVLLLLCSSTAQAQTPALLYLPMMVRSWPQPPAPPNISPIDNADQDNGYAVVWSAIGNGETFILEESTTPDFSTPAVVYQGNDITWQTVGRLPGTYYYRAKSLDGAHESEWSAAQSVTIYPLFVGMHNCWDGVGFIRWGLSYDVGHHRAMQSDSMTEADTIQFENYVWYDPNPVGFDSDFWHSFYSVVTGEFKSSDLISDPSWKWHYSWKLEYQTQYADRQKVTIDGQSFKVYGPKSGYTVYGKAIQYWEFINLEKFLYHDSGGTYTQYVHAGDVVLRYDVGPSRLLIYDSIMRRAYKNGKNDNGTVQYIENLSASNAVPGSPTPGCTLEPPGAMNAAPINYLGMGGD